MPIQSFFSDKPEFNDVGVDHNTSDGRRLDELMHSPAYLDPTHPRHVWTRGQVEAGHALVYGERPVGGPQPYSPVSFPSAIDGEAKS